MYCVFDETDHGVTVSDLKAYLEVFQLTWGHNPIGKITVWKLDEERRKWVKQD